MKYLLLLISPLFILSCSKSDIEKPDCTPVMYSESFSVVLNDEICLPDGSGFIVKTITDEFCPCDVACVWEGELKVMIETIEANGEKDLFSFGSSSYIESPVILTTAKIEEFTFDYESGELPDCVNEYDPSNVTLHMKVIEHP